MQVAHMIYQQCDNLQVDLSMREALFACQHKHQDGCVCSADQGNHIEHAEVAEGGHEGKNHQHSPPYQRPGPAGGIARVCSNGVIGHVAGNAVLWNNCQY